MTDVVFISPGGFRSIDYSQRRTCVIFHILHSLSPFPYTVHKKTKRTRLQTRGGARDVNTRSQLISRHFLMLFLGPARTSCMHERVVEPGVCDLEGNVGCLMPVHELEADF